MMDTIFRGLCITAMAATALSISADPPHLEQPISAIMQGTTANASGVPVADVEVSCWWFDASMFEPPTFTRGGETRSGADGRFALMCPHPMGALDPSVPPGMLLGFVVTRHPDYGITVTPWQRIGAGLTRGATQLSEVPPELMPPRGSSPILLPAPARATGTVRDPQGAPVAGATITVSIGIPYRVRKRVPPPGFYDPNPGPDQMNRAQRLDAILSTTTGADGAFVLEGLPADSPIALHVYHPEAGEAALGVTPGSPDGQPFTLQPGDAPCDVVLPGAGSLIGRVGLPPEGALPKDAHVRLTRHSQTGIEHRNALIEAEGRYAVPALAPGPYQLELIAPPWTANLATVSVESGGVAEAPDLAAGPGAFLAGTFVDATTGEPAIDVKPRIILVYQNEGVTPIETEINAGHFEFQARPGIVTLQVTATNGQIAPDDMEKQLVLKHGTRNESLQFRFTPFQSVTGHVLLPDGEPAAGAVVSMGPFFSTKADTNGRFSIALPPLDPQQQEQSISAAFGEPATHLGAAKVGPDVTITVDLAASISGRLVDGVGQPLAGRPSLVLQGAASERGTRTDAQGRFLHTGLVPGYTQMLSTGPGFMNLDPPLKAGEHRELGDIPIDVARFPEQPMTVIDVPVSAMKGHS